MKRILALFCYLALINNSFANNPIYAVDNIPDSLLTNAHTVIRFAQQAYTVKDIGHASEKIKQVITIINDKSTATDLRVYYDQFTKVGRIKARLYDANGQKIRDIKKDEINDLTRCPIQFLGPAENGK